MSDSRMSNNSRFVTALFLVVLIVSILMLANSGAMDG